MRQQEHGPITGKAPQAQQEGLQALAPLMTPLLPLTQQLKKNNSCLLSQPVPCRGEVRQELSQLCKHASAVPLWCSEALPAEHLLQGTCRFASVLPFVMQGLQSHGEAYLDLGCLVQDRAQLQTLCWTDCS